MFFVIFIIALGLIFIFIEIFFIPGTGLVGILGGALVIGGVVLAYIQFGSTTGNLILLISSIIFLIMTITGFKRISELKWGLNEHVEGRVNVLEENLVKPGDKGIAFTDLRPNGKAIINDLRLEVYSVGEFVDKDTPVEVTKVTTSKIYVKHKQV